MLSLLVVSRQASVRFQRYRLWLGSQIELQRLCGLEMMLTKKPRGLSGATFQEQHHTLTEKALERRQEPDFGKTQPNAITWLPRESQVTQGKLLSLPTT